MSKITKISQLKTALTKIQSLISELATTTTEAITEVDDNVETLSTTVESDYVKISSIVNNCTSTTTTAPLSAYQGKVLKDEIDNVSDSINKLVDTETGTTYTLSVEGGILCIDDGEE